MTEETHLQAAKRVYADGNWQTAMRHLFAHLEELASQPSVGPCGIDGVGLNTALDNIYTRLKVLEGQPSAAAEPERQDSYKYPGAWLTREPKSQPTPAEPDLCALCGKAKDDYVHLGVTGQWHVFTSQEYMDGLRKAPAQKSPAAKAAFGEQPAPATGQAEPSRSVKTGGHLADLADRNAEPCAHEWARTATNCFQPDWTKHDIEMCTRCLTLQWSPVQAEGKS